MGSADRLKIAVDAATVYVVNGGTQLNFPQGFFIDVRDGKVRGMQAYEPYSPHGNVVIITITQREKYCPTLTNLTSSIY